MRASAPALLAALVAIGAVATAVGDDQKPAKRGPRLTLTPPTPKQIADARVAFGPVAKVLLSPRCRNCHPRGDRPLQTDAGIAHQMNISRRSVLLGLPCGTCHQESNSEAVGVRGGPPGAPHWGMPPKTTPMIFEGHTPRTLCEQLRDPARNGKRSLADLYEHVNRDPLVLWAWKPGGGRTLPPLRYPAFIAAFERWVRGGGACPETSR